MAGLLAVEREYLKENQEELRQKHPGKYLLIKGTEVHGAYETWEKPLPRAFGISRNRARPSWFVR